MENKILINGVYGNLLKALVELKPLVELKASIELKKREPLRLPNVHAWEIRERNQV